MKGALSWPFLRLYLLTLLYFSANAILNVIIPLKGQALGASNSTIGIVMGAYMLTTMILRPWAGQVIHRYGPIRILRIILTVNGIALLLYTFTGIGGYFFARILQGVCTAFFSMALQLGIIDTLPEQDRSQGISMYSLCSYIPGIIGPLLAIGIWQTGEVSLFAITMIALAGLTGLVGFTANMEQQPGRGWGTKRWFRDVESSKSSYTQSASVSKQYIDVGSIASVWCSNHLCSTICTANHTSKCRDLFHATSISCCGCSFFAQK